MARLEVHVVTPEREVWSGEADMLIARAADGEIGILPGHAPLLSLLDVGPLVIVDGSERRGAVVDGGFLHVAGDRVDVLAEHAELAEEIDVSQAEARRSELEAAAREGDQAARTELARVNARITVVQRQR